MIEKISIKNFKTITDLNLNLSRITVLVGENGSGKSNILESIAFGSTILFNNSKRLPKETLQAKGVRINDGKDISPYFKDSIKDIETQYEFSFSNNEVLSFNVDNEFACHFKTYAKKSKIIFDLLEWRKISSDTDKYINASESITIDNNEKDPEKLQDTVKELERINLLMKKQLGLVEKTIKNIESIIKSKKIKSLNDFCIYSPENSQLRKFEDESQFSPIGYRGDGLFKEIKNIFYKDKELLDDIIKHLQTLEWFENFTIEKTNFPGETKISIQDKYLASNVFYLDQRNANEGFLFLLFYLTVFSSKKTPKFFAIDNIEASFNPKLCTRLIQLLIVLAKKYDKQVIITTHNPFILDGLNLEDTDQSLIVVRRNIKGHTITSKLKIKDKLDVKLSEAWMRGYIGGLPNNF